ncbi:MAG: apolipoprotein N-acyltransferase Lnt [Pseudomonadota bacterium]
MSGRELFLAVCVGAAHTLAYPLTWAWWLPLLAVTWLVSRLNRLRPKPAAALALAFGVGWLCAGVWWLFVSMHRYGQLPAWLAAAAVSALSLALSTYLAVAGACYAAWRTGRPGVDAALFAALWTLAECARGVLWTGFPWVASGYAWVDAPWAALAPWVGVYGMGAALAAMAAWLAGAFFRPHRSVAPKPAHRWTVLALGGVASGVLAVVGPVSFTQPAGRVSVSLIQTDVAQDEKFSLEKVPAALAWLADALQQSPGQLVVTPETAVPLLPSQMQDLAPGWWEAQVAFFNQPDRAALVGVPLGDFSNGYTNSVIGLTASPAPYRYDKHHLVPFGEFIPLGFRWFTQLMNLPLGDFERGRLAAPSFLALGQRLAPNICYEDLFGEELAARFQVPDQAPTVLVNVSNIAWFGDTVALPQHLHITRLRTLELQRPMLRATNTGMTAVVDHTGQVVKALPPFSRGILHGEVEGRTGLTPFAWWAGRWGLWPWVLCAAAVVVGVWRYGRRPFSAQSGPNRAPGP